MGCVHFEGAVVRPKIDGRCDAGYAALVDLSIISLVVAKHLQGSAYHFSRLSTAN
jgi:hypothetical protein